MHYDCLIAGVLGSAAGWVGGMSLMYFLGTRIRVKVRRIEYEQMDPNKFIAGLLEKAKRK